ncbi:DNA translocase FtsK 4TM domain-containing protein, partial [Candidatus Marinimicrobia bacterium]|nr:DNA translocase FtsK 4TM domain-containing protein [Candidatus Neomarinimicrobiota bacterium]
MNNQRRLEILGILLITISLFFFISFVGYNANEEPSISPNIVIENSMGIFGVFISHIFIKLGFGYVSILIPFCGFLWGWFLFSKKKIDQLFKMTKFFFISIVLISFTIGTFINYISPQDKNYLPSGLIGGNLAELFISFFSELGTFLFIIVSFLVLLRGYFDLNYYKPFENLINTIKKLKNN